MTYNSIARILAGMALVASSSSFAALPTTIECNDCNDTQRGQLAKNYLDQTLLMVDVVSRTVNKFTVDKQGNVSQNQVSLGDVNHVNRIYDHRKTTLRAAK
ncbi:hypothetical protein [Shewanella waksmanii]|uniref:hypothetical protein n=1 Tax=Shewanella waksmanii TaxID=213783 RepID=UPI0037355E48